MGRRSSQRGPNPGQFYGIGLPVGERRPNAQDGSYTPRKIFPYLRREQRGTPIESYLRDNYEEILEQGNRISDVPFDMKPEQSTGSIRPIWDRIGSKMTGAKAINKYIEKHGGSLDRAKAGLLKAPWISFGADPKSK